MHCPPILHSLPLHRRPLHTYTPRNTYSWDMVASTKPQCVDIPFDLFVTHVGRHDISHSTDLYQSQCHHIREHHPSSTNLWASIDKASAPRRNSLVNQKVINLRFVPRCI
jgi:hypothetical protein